MDAGHRFHIPTGTSIDDRYTIVRAIGEGGWATVYEAIQHTVDREVALKILDIVSLGELGDPTVFERRFLQEASAISRIDHPCSVAIYDTGIFSEHRLPYIAMELLEGHDLEEELLQRHRVSPERFLPLFLDALEALDIAHRNGIIHRDLKPANIFIQYPDTDEERLKLLDFGIARVQSETKLTSQGELFGTPRYLAPEWIVDQTVSPAIDVYQMGLCLAEALSGMPVVDHDTPYQCLNAHTRGELNVPSYLLMEPLGPILLKALDRDPQERYPDAGALREALAALDPSAIELPVNPLPSRTPRPPIRARATPASLPQDGATQMLSPPVALTTSGDSRKRAAIAVAALLLLLLLILLVWSPWREEETPAQKTADAGAATTATTPPETSPSPPDPPPAAPDPAEAQEVATELEPAPDVIEPPEPEVVDVRVTSRPRGASIVRDGERIGKTPDTLSLPAGAPVVIKLRKRGYRSLELELTPREGLHVKRTLRKDAPPPTTTPSFAP